MPKNNTSIVARLVLPEGIRYENNGSTEKKNDLKGKVLDFYENLKSLNLGKWIEYQIFVKHNKPEPFIKISKDEYGNYILPAGFSSVEEIGKPEKTDPHLTKGPDNNTDTGEYEIANRMTYLKNVFPKSFNGSNAFYIKKDKFEEIQNNVGVTYFQPLELKPKPLIQILKNEHENYILPKGFSSLEKVGGIQKIKVHISNSTNGMCIGENEIANRIAFLNHKNNQFDSNAFYIEKKEEGKADVTYFQPLKLKK